MPEGENKFARRFVLQAARLYKRKAFRPYYLLTADSRYL
jgi:hypothetical protein